MSKSAGPIPRIYWLVGSVIAVFALYGKSIPYEFVYDDVVRVTSNSSLKPIPSVRALLFDRNTQSSRPSLNRHTYRPLSVLDYAVDFHFWGPHPPGFRIKNLAFHALNGWLVGLVGIVAFQATELGALIAALFFLLHPVQVESVVWVSERSNVMSVFLMLLGFLQWSAYRREKRKSRLGLATALLIGALLYRETAVCFPIAIIILDRVLFNDDADAAFSRSWPVYVLFGGIVAVYLILRQFVLGNFAQVPMSGGLLKNIGTVFQVWPLTIQSVLFPYPQTVNYPPVPLSLSKAATGFLVFSLFSVASVALLYYGRRSLAACGFLFIVFWLPTSQLIPLSKMFNERFLYPMMPFSSVALGLIVDDLLRSARMAKRTAHLLAGSVAVLLVTATSSYVPVWQNNFTLWAHAVDVNPDSWFNWSCLAEAQKKIGLEKSDRAWLDVAETSFARSLSLGVPQKSAAQVLLSWAETNWYQRKPLEAQRRARQAAMADPEIEKDPAWVKMR